MKTRFRPLARALSLVAAVLALNLGPAPQAAPAGEDPFLWLEDIESPRALEWVARQNARTSAVLESDRRYAPFLAEARAIFTASDRIAWPSLRGSEVDNVWQDAGHVQGVWRTSSAAAYRSGRPDWTTLIDLDALSKAEGRHWIFKGATCLPPAVHLHLPRFSGEPNPGRGKRINDLPSHQRLVANAASRAIARRSSSSSRQSTSG